MEEIREVEKEITFHHIIALYSQFTFTKNSFYELMLQVGTVLQPQVWDLR